MARLFNDASNQYLYYSGALITTEPLSMSCWFYSDDLTIDQVTVGIGDTATSPLNGWNLQLAGTTANDPIRAITTGGGTSRAAGVNNYPTGQWAHGVGVFASASSRAVYLNNTKGTNTQTSTVGGTINVTRIAARACGTQTNYMSGRVAEIGIWNIALTDADVAQLYKGFSPLLVRPESLVYYIPLIRDNDKDLVSGVTFTAANSPTVETHAPVFYYAPVPIVWHITGGFIEGSATLSGTGTIAATANKDANATAALSATGTVLPAGSKLMVATTALSATGSIVPAGSELMVGTGALNGSGSLSAVGVKDANVTVSLAASGSVTAVGTKQIDAVTSLSASGSLAAIGVSTLAVTTSLTGSGTVVAEGTIGGTTHLGTATLVASGSLSGVVNLIQRTDASLTATSSLAAIGSYLQEGVTTLSGSASLVAECKFFGILVASLTGTGTLAAIGSLSIVAGTGPGTRMVYEAADRPEIFAEERETANAAKRSKVRVDG